MSSFLLGKTEFVFNISNFDLAWRLVFIFYLCKTDILSIIYNIFSSFVFLPSFAKERRRNARVLRIRQKEERKTVVARNGSQKIRSKSTSEFYRT